MNSDSILRRLAQRVLLVACVLWPHQVSADDAADQALLRQKTLRAVGAYFVLADEPKLNAMFGEVRTLKRKLDDANRPLQRVEREVQQNKNLLVQYIQQRRVLRQRQAHARSARQNNQIVAAMNELGDRITLLMQGGDRAEQLRAARATASQAREQYAEHVIQIRERYDQLTEQYKQLASDKQVQTAMENLNRSQGKKRQLGPNLSFRRHGSTLAKLEKTVFSQSIDLRRGPGGLLYVVAYFNGKHAQEIAVDTGASIVTLPDKVARQAGIEISDDDPSITLRIADGGTFEARQVTIGSVRVGQFTVENVTCAVLPDKFAEAPPLLGQSYLRHFVYKIDASSGKLIMTKVGAQPAPSGR